MHKGGGRIILSDGGGIRRNVIIVQKPTATVAVTTTTVTPVSSVTRATDDIPVVSTTLSPPKVSSAFEQVRRRCNHVITSRVWLPGSGNMVCHRLPPTLTFDHLILKLVCESRGNLRSKFGHARPLHSGIIKRLTLL